jgi:hypothetical protein
MPDEMIAYCGLVCTGCEAYLATRDMDQDKAAKTAAMWSKQFQIEVKVDDVWCDGCLVEGKKCAHCARCEIRACARDRGVVNCGKCDDYGCEKLEAFFKMAPMARDTLERVRAG